MVADPVSSPGQPRVRTGGGLGADLVAVVAVVVGVLVVARVGWRLLGAGTHLILGFPPLMADWMPHLGPGAPVAVGTAVLVIRCGPGVAERMGWRPLLWWCWASACAWTFGLALIDGWDLGVAGRLTTPDEYLHDVPMVPDIPAMLATFTDHILTNQAVFWTTHVGAHPPGVFLLFIWLDRLGLGGGGPAGVVVILVGASAGVAVAVTLRALGAEPCARAALPYLVVFPGAVWVGVSADGMFAAVLAWGVALVTLGATTTGARGDLAAATGGFLLGYTLYLSYGLTLGMPLALGVVVLTRRPRTVVIATCAAGAVALVFTAAGFCWLTGYHDLMIIYPLSAAEERPYEYFVWANLAAFAATVGPAAIAGLRRLVTSPRTLPAAPAVLVALAGAAVAVADLSGLSKAEVERIWLPFAVWLIPACALLPPEHRRGWLTAQATLAIAINSLLITTW